MNLLYIDFCSDSPLQWNNNNKKNVIATFYPKFQPFVLYLQVYVLWFDSGFYSQDWEFIFYICKS